MIQSYTEVAFIVDILSEEYKTKNPHEIVKKAREIMGSNITPEEVSVYLNVEQPQLEFSLNMKQIF